MMNCLKQVNFLFTQQYGLIRVKSGPVRIGVAQRKILIALTYFVILAVFALTSFTLAARNANKFYQQLFNYYSCEVGGHSDL